MARHHPEYWKAVADVEVESLEEDLALIDDLFGRDKLRYGATPAEVKAEALRQLEIEWRVPIDPWRRTGVAGCPPRP